jgi:hypothetical protein
MFDVRLDITIVSGLFRCRNNREQREVATTIVFDNAIVKNRIRMMINDETKCLRCFLRGRHGESRCPLLPRVNATSCAWTWDDFCLLRPDWQLRFEGHYYTAVLSCVPSRAF